jgi:hypothetical protein
MNNKIYIIATPENKHLIIPYLESLGGKVHPAFNDGTFECKVGLKYWIDAEGCMDGANLGYPIQGYTEIHLKEQDGVICAYGAGGGVPLVGSAEGIGGAFNLGAGTFGSEISTGGIAYSGGVGGESTGTKFIKYPNGGDIINPSELEQLKKDNEQLRECLAKGLYAVEIWCATIEEHVDEYDTQFIEQAKQLLK